MKKKVAITKERDENRRGKMEGGEKGREEKRGKKR
jgi:hypothetical protein